MTGSDTSGPPQSPGIATEARFIYAVTDPDKWRNRGEIGGRIEVGGGRRGKGPAGVQNGPAKMMKKTVRFVEATDGVVNRDLEVQGNAEAAVELPQHGDDELEDRLGATDNCSRVTNRCDLSAAGEENPVMARMEAHLTKSRPTDVTTVKLLPGERLGWWSTHQYDKRTRRRAVVNGAVNDYRTTILLDTGANLSAISEGLARKLKLRRRVHHKERMEVQGIGPGVVSSSERVTIKVTLGWRLAYEFEVWVMPHCAGVDLILGTDFMFPAGVRLNLFHATVQLPDETEVPLVRTLSETENRRYGNTVTGSPGAPMDVPARQTVTFKLQRMLPTVTTHEMWVRRAKFLVPTILMSKSGCPKAVRLTNISMHSVWCPAFFPFVQWIPVGDLPKDDGYTRTTSWRYRDWQVQAYENAMDRNLLARERVLYEEWLSRQPPAVEKPPPAVVSDVLRRPPDDSAQPRRRQLTCAERWEKIDAATEGDTGGDDRGSEESFSEHEDDTDSDSDQERCTTGSVRQPEPGFGDVERPTMTAEWVETATEATEDSVTPPAIGTENQLPTPSQRDAGARELDTAFMSVAAVLTDDDETDCFVHQGNSIDLDDYAHELAYLPDLVEEIPTELDYTGPNVMNPELTKDEQAKLVKVLKKHEKIMISSGNALPPPAYGAICDIDVQGHAPIRQRARRIPLKYLKKLYELLRGLLKAGLIAFSGSPWASPIVIVPKKNKVDIRLCIDYKMLNAVTAALMYAMPLVDDLLTELQAYLWFCSLDAASGFWAVMMTRRARLVSAFVCALGHFEWLRMPFGLKNAPMIYQKLIDNALWGYVQPKGGWAWFAKRMQQAEETSRQRRLKLSAATTATESESAGLSKFEGDHQAATEDDPLSLLINSELSNMFEFGEPDESDLIPVLERRSFVDDICFGGTTFDDCLTTLDRLLERFTECRISISFAKSTFVQSSVDFLSHRVSSDGIAADPKKLQAIQALPFPKSKKGMQSFLGALNYYGRFIQDLAAYGAMLYQLKEDDFGPGGDLSVARRAFDSLKQKVADAPILKHFDPEREVHVMLFANEWAMSSTLMQRHDGKLHPVRFCSRVLKDSEQNYYPAEKEVLALLHLLKTCYTLLAGLPLHVYTRFSTLEWVFQSKSLFGRTVKFATILSPWDLNVTRIRDKDVDFARLLQATVTPFVDLDRALEPFAPPSKGSAELRVDPRLLYVSLPRDFAGYVLSFDGSAKTEKHGGDGSCSWILWQLPNWDIVIAATAHLSTATVNTAEYTGMNNGVRAALQAGVTDLIIVGDSRLAIQQSMGVMACKKETLQTQLAVHKELTKQLNSVRYLHVVREFNSAADSLAGECLGSKISKVVLGQERKEELAKLNRIQEVIYAESGENKATETANAPDDDTKTATERERRALASAEPTARKVAFAAVMTRAQARGDSRQNPRSASPVRDTVVNQRNATKETPEKASEGGVGTEPSELDEDDAPPVATDTDDTEKALEVQAERRRRISVAQDEEERWNTLKKYLKGEVDKLSAAQAAKASKFADQFVLDEDGVLYHVGKDHKGDNDSEREARFQLVVPTTLVEEVLQNCHDSLESGHQGIVRTYMRVRRSYFWIGLYADVVNHVKTCGDCCTAKSVPQLRGFSPGNIIASRPFQIVSMDFVIPLPKSAKGNTALLLFQDHFTGFVMAKPMSKTGAVETAQAFEECVVRRFGAPALIRHDRDPRFMGKVFQAFVSMMLAKSRATMSYRPQANGQQERSVKTMVQTIRTYVESPLQNDWDDVAEKLASAINSSVDTTRKETPFYLVHGWDARSTFQAMSDKLDQGPFGEPDAGEWRRQLVRQHRVAWKLAKDYQLKEKDRRAKLHNDQLARLERMERSRPGSSKERGNQELADSAGSRRVSQQTALLKPGTRVWLFMERVKPGLTKKLAHRWHGPFRIKEKVEDFAYKLELPNEAGYRFHPVVHVSRLKPVSEHTERPVTRLAEGVTEGLRFDFDEELLPEDSWEADESQGQYEVEAILDDDRPLSTGTTKAEWLFQVKWKGYSEPTWEPLSHLACGGLLFDYLQHKKQKNRLQMVQVADEDDLEELQTDNRPGEADA